MVKFHQHFTSSFCADILLSQTVIREKLLKALLNKKCEHKMLMKLSSDGKMTILKLNRNNFELETDFYL